MHLILKRLTLHNIGVYRGRHTINLYSGLSGQPVTLIGALNGSGKTTILEVLQVGLYGEKADVSRRGRTGYQEYLRSLINRDAGVREGAALTLDFEVQGHGEYSVTRTWTLAGQSIKESVEASINGAADGALAERWQEEIERLFPQRLCKLFFFDGEQIEALADPSQTAKVLRTAVSALLGIDLIDQADRDLAILIRKAAIGEENSEYAREYLEVESNLADMNGRIADIDSKDSFLDSELALKRAELRAVDEKFSAQGGDLYKRAGELEKARGDVHIEIAHIDHGLRALAAGSLPLALVKAQLRILQEEGSSLTLAQGASTAKRELQAVRKKVLDTLRGLADAPTVINEVSEIFEIECTRLDQLSTNSDCFGLEHRDVDLINTVLDGDLNEVRQSARVLIEKRASAHERALEVEQQIAAVPEESAIADLMSLRSALMAEIQIGEAESKNRKNDIEGLHRERVRLEQACERLARHHAESEELSERARNRVNAAQEVRERLQQLKDKMLTKHISSIEGATLGFYNRLLRKRNLVQRISVDPETMEVTLQNKDDQIITTERLSAGERQLLATAILWALASLSNNQLPVVIDTPLGRLDSEHRANLVQEYFPNASHQVVLLSTDEEIDSRYYKMLSPSIGRALSLEYSEQDRTSYVREGYFLGVAA